MLYCRNIIFFSLILSSIAIIYCLQVIPERAEVYYINTIFVSDVVLNVRRYSRKGAYYINLRAQVLEILDNSISFDFIFYEFLHNEYKRTFVELHYPKLCEVLNDKYIGKTFLNAGAVCPVPKGYTSLDNMTIPTDDFPNVWPFERARVYMVMKHTPTASVVANGSLYFTFKQKPLRQKNMR